MRGTSIPAAILFALFATPGAAQQPDPERGRALAERWCVACHITEEGAAGGDAGPPFPVIVNRLDRSEGALRGWLSAPHPQMPDPNLSSIQIDDILAFLESLRR